MLDKNNKLELRMYFFVPYNISEIQKGIQAGHASLEYANEFGNTNLFKEFITKWKTWIILNGGSTNNNHIMFGTLQEIKNEIEKFNLINPNNKILFSTFYEPDLNGALTAICFICDERSFNSEKYKELQIFHDDWEKFMGKENIFLINLLKDKKLA